MSERSSRSEHIRFSVYHHHWLACVALGLAACKGEATKKRVTGDPARVTTLANYMVNNAPGPGSAPPCQPEDFLGGFPVNHLSLLKISKQKYRTDPEHADWIYPRELEDPSVQALVDDKATKEAKAEAAGAFLAAKFYVVYRVENVDAPMALAVKDPKIGTIGTRIIKYDTKTLPVCAMVFHFQNTKEKSEWAIDKSDRALIDPTVAQAMRDDLTARFIELAPRTTPPKKP